MRWMDSITIIEAMMPNNNSKKENFSELRDYIFAQTAAELTSFGWQSVNNDHVVKISSLKNSKEIIEGIRTLKVIELDSLESFLSYLNYDHFLIFKFKNEYYFCDTILAPSLGLDSMIKISDFNQFFRKDKIKKINEKLIN